MPITSSAKKALRNSAKKRVFNLRRKKKVADLTKEIKSLTSAKNADEAQKMLSAAYKAIDKAAKGGTIKKTLQLEKEVTRLAKLIKRSA